MSSVFKGLAALKQHEQEREERAGSRVNWLKVNPDETVEIVFLQEMDESSERYLADNGLVLFAQEHSNPEQFMKRVVCTNNEDHDGQCWACQKNQQMWNANASITDEKKKYKGGWKPKTNMYVNVLVRREGKDDEVAVLSRTRSKQSYVDQLIEDAEDEGYISNRWYRLARTGEGRDTSYRLKGLKDAGLDLSEYGDKLFDLSALITEVDYDAQPGALGVMVAPERVDVPADEDDDSDEWL